MLFCSYVFVLLFLPLTAAGYFLLNKWHHKAGKLYLLAASFFFYGYFNPAYLLLLAASLVFNYLTGMLLWKKADRLLLAFGIAVNILLLGYCKYYDFFVENINWIFGTDLVLKNLLLPLGISFFTFQQISYLCDVYHRELAERYSPLTYTLFVTFFPQLVAGPIVLANEMMPQFADERNLKPDEHNLSCGIFVFSLGLAKKMLLADNFAGIADRTFNMAVPMFADSFTGTLAYCLQIYFDFSGYCDMAIGIGLIFNIKLPVNFYAPYLSANIQEFWRKWHITLGRFMSQFVYIPLGGSREGRVRTYINLAITFLVSGLWHGANWMMILWGALHGTAIVIHRILGIHDTRVRVIVLTFVFVWLVWIFFRAENAAQAGKVLAGFTDFNAAGFREFTDEYSLNTLGLFIVSAFIIIFLPPANSFASKEFQPKRWHLTTAFILLLSSIFCFNRISPFIYFNF